MFIGTLFTLYTVHCTRTINQVHFNCFILIEIVLKKGNYCLPQTLFLLPLYLCNQMSYTFILTIKIIKVKIRKLWVSNQFNYCTMYKIIYHPLLRDSTESITFESWRCPYVHGIFKLWRCPNVHGIFEPWRCPNVHGI